MWRLRLIGLFIPLLVVCTSATAADSGEATPAGQPLAIAADSGEATPAGQPLAIAETTSYTFPPVLEGTEARHDFVIRNMGDAPLIIHEVKAA